LNTAALTSPSRKRELLLSLKYCTIEACFSVPMLNLTTSNLPFLIGFAVSVLGWKSAAVGFMAAIPHLCNFLQPPITHFLQRFFSLHKIMLLGFVFNALPWVFVSIFPWLGEQRHLVFTLIVFTSTLANSVCAVAWSAAVSELVPLQIRGQYFGRRNLIFGFWTLVVVLAAGQYADYFDNSLQAFGALFSAAAAARLIGMFYLTRMKFPASVMQRREQLSPLGDYVRVLRDRNYLQLLLFIGLFGLFLNFGMPFYNVYLLRELRLSLGDLTVLTTLSSFGGLVSLKSWGPLCDRFGSKPVIAACAMTWAVSAGLAWLFSAPTRISHLYVNYFLIGFVTAGFQLAQFNLMIKLVPADRRAHYISVFFAVTSLLTALGPIIGGRILQSLPQEFGTFLGTPFTRFHLVFVVSMVFCFAMVPLLRRLQEPAERPLRELVRVMRGMREFNPVLGLASLAQYVFTPRRLTEWASESMRSLRRQGQAVSDVGEELVVGGIRTVRRRFRGPPGK
jgi:Na+/melibiose symporter-like transporter